MGLLAISKWDGFLSTPAAKFRAILLPVCVRPGSMFFDRVSARARGIKIQTTKTESKVGELLRSELSLCPKNSFSVIISIVPKELIPLRHNFSVDCRPLPGVLMFPVLSALTAVNPKAVSKPIWPGYTGRVANKPLPIEERFCAPEARIPSVREFQPVFYRQYLNYLFNVAIAQLKIYLGL